MHLQHIKSFTVPIDGDDVVTQTGPRRPPHNYVYIVKSAVEPFDKSSREKICEQLYDGVLLDAGKKMYWVDRVLNKNCFMVLAKDLGIVHIESSKYWEWDICKETRNATIEVALLKAVCWLEINGKFQTIALSPNTLYRVSFVFKMVGSNFNWSIPVNFKITFPDGNEETCRRSLGQLPKGQWIHVPICEFVMSPEKVGEMTFGLMETSGQWKGGLILKGVSFMPKN